MEARGLTPNPPPIRHGPARMQPMRLALYQPDIAQNTGTMLRLAACLGVGVNVIAPTGFDMTDRALRRAELDYLAHVEIVRHASFCRFRGGRGSASGSRLVLLTTRAEGSPNTQLRLPGHRHPARRPARAPGVPEAVHQAADARLRIPIRPGLRSLNVGSRRRHGGWARRCGRRASDPQGLNPALDAYSAAATASARKPPDWRAQSAA